MDCNSCGYCVHLTRGIACLRDIVSDSVYPQNGYPRSEHARRAEWWQALAPVYAEGFDCYIHRRGQTSEEELS